MEVRNAACAVQYLVVVQTMLVRCPKNLDFTMFQKVSLSNLIFVCSRLDRFCKSTKEGIRTADTLLNKGAKVHILNMGIIDNSESGKSIYKMLQAFDVFQHECKLDKMNMVRNPESIGRKKKYTKEQLDKAIKLLDEHSYFEVSEITGISTATILREKRLREEQEGKE